MTDLRTHSDRTREVWTRATAQTQLLWTVLVIAVVANSIASIAGAGIVTQLTLGTVTGVCAVALALPYLRRRR